MLLRLQNYIKLNLILVFFYGFIGSINADQYEPPEKNVEYFSIKLLDLYKKNKYTYQKNKSLFFEEINKQLTPIVAFNQISKYIMGKYARINPELVKLFEKNFKTTLFKVYGNILLSLDDSKVSIESVGKTPKRILDAYYTKQISNIKVKVALKTPKQVVDIYYSMVLEDQKWKLRNVIAMGVSIAEQFKNQFNQAVSKYGDIDVVVKNWDSILEGKSFK